MKTLNLAQLKSIENGLIKWIALNPKEYEKIKFSYPYVYLIHRPCNTKIKIHLKKFNAKQNRISCGVNECKQIKAKKTNLKKYGVANPAQADVIKDKIKKTNLDRYGVENVYQSDVIKNKIKQTIFNRYGKHTSQLQQTKDKIKKTNLDRYGVEWQTQSDSFKNKSKQTCLKKYGVDHYSKTKKFKIKFYYNLLKLKKLKPLFKLEDYNGTDYNNKYDWQCEKCNTVFKDHLYSGHFPRCPKCYPKLSGTSKQEKELQEWIKTLKIKSENNKWFNKDKKRYELDVYIHEFNLGIEFNGIYWHSELQGKDKNYHLNKSKWFKDNFGIDIIHVWSSEWLEKQNVVKGIIKNKLKLNKSIYGRKTIIKEITSKEAKIFCDENHLQGFVGAKYHYGLFYNDELVSYMSLGKTRYNKMYDYELIRFTNKINYNVVGGFSKLLKYFENNHKGSIISYVDRRYFNGQGYLKNNFNYIGNTTSNYFYTNDYNMLFSRITFQKHKLKDKLNNFNEALSEWENMQLNGYDRIWDCGNMIMIKNYK